MTSKREHHIMFPKLSISSSPTEAAPSHPLEISCALGIKPEGSNQPTNQPTSFPKYPPPSLWMALHVIAFVVFFLFFFLFLVGGGGRRPPICRRNLRIGESQFGGALPEASRLETGPEPNVFRRRLQVATKAPCPLPVANMCVYLETGG